MSIVDKLTYLNETKHLLREAINAAGGNLTQETTFREYAGGWLRDQSASLILDFSKQQYVAKDKVSMFPDRVGFEDIVTFTRSTGGGRFNAQGQYEWLPADTPRIDYDPVTGECKGLLIEEQRTNLIPYSDNAAEFLTYQGSGIERSLNGVTPHGLPITRLTTIAGGVVHGAYEGNIGHIGNHYCVSAYIHPHRATTVRIRTTRAVTGAYHATATLDVSTGQVTVTGVVDAKGGAEPLGNGWWRIWASRGPVPANGGSNHFRIQSVDDLAAGEYIEIAGIQSEEGSFPTSYIPTEEAQVTRAADIATVNDLAPWYSPNQGSFSIKAKGHTGEPLFTVGDAFIIADSDELKEYPVSYSEDPQATQVDIGKGLIESVRYWPRETA